MIFYPSASTQFGPTLQLTIPAGMTGCVSLGFGGHAAGDRHFVKTLGPVFVTLWGQPVSSGATIQKVRRSNDVSDLRMEGVFIGESYPSFVDGEIRGRRLVRHGAENAVGWWRRIDDTFPLLT